MTKIKISPAEEGYQVAYQPQATVAVLEGGPSRYRRDLLGARNKVSVEWYVDRDGYDYMMAFYRAATLSGAASFTLDLFVDYAELATYEAWISPGTFQLNRIIGDAYVFGAELEVPSLPWDPVLDAAILDGYEELQGNDDLIYLLLNQLVNEHLPEVA